MDLGNEALRIKPDHWKTERESETFHLKWYGEVSLSRKVFLFFFYIGTTYDNSYVGRRLNYRIFIVGLITFLRSRSMITINIIIILN